jgi:hypothetical protein
MFPECHQGKNTLLLMNQLHFFLFSILSKRNSPHHFLPQQQIRQRQPQPGHAITQQGHQDIICFMIVNIMIT